MKTTGWPSWRRLNQEGIVFAIAVVLFVAAAIGLPGFIDPNNLVAIVRSVSVLGILALGMAVVIIGRGIDLSAGASMAMSVAWYLQLLNTVTAARLAFTFVLAVVPPSGLLNGFPGPLS